MLSVDSQGSGRRRWIVFIVLVILVSAGTAAGVALTVLEFNPLEPAQGSLDDSALVIEGESLSYQGLNADSLNLTVNNTDSVDHTADITVRLVNSSGTTVHTESETGVQFNGSSTESHVIDINPNQNVTTFESVEVLLEETG